MKRILFILLTTITILTSCASTIYTDYGYDDTSYVTYYHEYYYNGAYRPVIYRNSVYYYYYLNTWYRVPTHHYCNIHRFNKPHRFEYHKHIHGIGPGKRHNYSVRPNNNHRPNSGHSVKPNNSHRPNGTHKPNNNHSVKPNSNHRPNGNHSVRSGYNNSNKTFSNGSYSRGGSSRRR